MRLEHEAQGKLELTRILRADNRAERRIRRRAERTPGTDGRIKVRVIEEIKHVSACEHAPNPGGAARVPRGGDSFACAMLTRMTLRVSY